MQLGGRISKNPWNPGKFISTDYSLFFSLTNWNNRVNATPNDIPKAIISQNPASLGLVSILE